MIKKADIILGLIILVIGGITCFFAYSFGETGDVLTISVEGKEYGRYELSKEQKIAIDKGEHHNVIEIKDGKGKMIQANCPDGYCLHQYEKAGGISNSNERLVCLPNRVIVTIESNSGGEVKGGEVDAVAD